MADDKLKIEADICRNALQVQDAVNLTGVLHSFTQDAVNIRKVVTTGNDDAARHPAMFLYAVHVAHLTGMGSANVGKYAEAHHYCTTKVQEADLKAKHEAAKADDEATAS